MPPRSDEILSLSCKCEGKWSCGGGRQGRSCSRGRRGRFCGGGRYGCSCSGRRRGSFCGCGGRRGGWPACAPRDGHYEQDEAKGLIAGSVVSHLIFPK